MNSTELSGVYFKEVSTETSCYDCKKNILVISLTCQGRFFFFVQTDDNVDTSGCNWNQLKVLGSWFCSTGSNKHKVI